MYFYIKEELLKLFFKNYKNVKLINGERRNLDLVRFSWQIRGNRSKSQVAKGTWLSSSSREKTIYSTSWATRPLEREMLLRNHTRATHARTHARLARKREGRQVGIRQEMICVVSPRPAEQYSHDSSSVSRCHEIDSKINPRLRCSRDLQRGQALEEAILTRSFEEIILCSAQIFNRISGKWNEDAIFIKEIETRLQRRYERLL